MNNKKVIYIAIIITILTFALSNIVFAKYSNYYSGTVASKIASPIIELSIKDNNKIITANEGANTTLNVSNYKEMDISNVGQNYYIQFYSDDVDISKFNINITNGEKQIQVNNGITETMFIQANEKETHTYNINITNNDNKESLKGTIKAKVISEQAEPK